MSIQRPLMSLAFAAGLLLPVEAANAGGPNVAVCMTLSNAYNQCVTDQRSRRPQPRGGYNQGYGGYGQGYDQGYGQGYGRGRGPYGQGYGQGYGGQGYGGQGYGGQGYGQGGGWGGGGGWGDDDDEAYGYRRRPQRRPPQPGIPYEQACANWLLQLKAAGCY